MTRGLLALVLIGGVCGAILTGVRHWTAPAIESNRAASARALIFELLATLQINPESIDAQTLRATTLGDCAAWRVHRVRVPGYSGEIEFAGAWRAADQTVSLRVVRHLETPGIGDFIDHTRDPWITALDGARRDEFAALDNVSGATITTQAVRMAAAQVFRETEQACDY